MLTLFFVVRFILSWLVWLIFADKRRWRSLGFVGVFAALLGCVADIVATRYPLWEYSDGVNPLFIDLSDNFSIYMVTAYLFIQRLPRKQNVIWMFAYWFAWTAITTGIEWVHLATGHMRYGLGWSLMHSYFAD
ncbi:MAG: hypothetical protein P4N41_10050 [Negativicutes bacterium]|nr:hypothetical protein [Negativicutes bacterium]